MSYERDLSREELATLAAPNDNSNSGTAGLALIIAIVAAGALIGMWLGDVPSWQFH